MIKNNYKKKVDPSLKSNCGVVGVYNHPEASIMAYYALHALQHRGQEAAGIVSSEHLPEKNKRVFNIHKGLGLVNTVFANNKILTDVLKGDAAIGHNRYSTTGASDNRSNIQPFKVNYKEGHLALSHNGNLTNTRSLRNALENEGTLFQTTTDSEIILHLIARSRETTLENKILDAFSKVQGAYSIVIMSDDKMFAVRDPYGVRPLCIGKLGDSYVITSETTALDIISAEYIRDVEPSEILILDRNTIETGEIKSLYMEKVPEYKHCIFEYIYFSRPDSMVFEEKVDKVRRDIGKALAEQAPPPDKDNPLSSDEKKVVVINVPDSSNTATLGYFSRSVKKNKNIKNEIGLIRSHYIGRTFIQPGQDQREMKVKTKFNIVKGVLKKRKVVMVDDSIVRGTTSKLLVDLIKKANPREIHLKITSPPVISPCYYGMDFPSKNELIANKHPDIEGIKDELGVTKLDYLTVDNLLKTVPYKNPKTGYCTACFTGEYPITIEKFNPDNKKTFDD